MSLRFDTPSDQFQRLLKHLDRVPLTRFLPVLWILGLGWIAFLWNLGALHLVDETEPLFTEAARQMTVTGDWLTPYFNGETRFDKPPLIYWLMAIAYQTFGVNEFAARLPSALSAIALTAMGFYTLRQFGFPIPAAVSAQNENPEPDPAMQKDTDLAAEKTTVATDQFEGHGSKSHGSQSQALGSRTTMQLRLSAWIGAGAIAVNVQTIAWARVGVSDMLLSGCMGTALMAFFCGYAQPHQRGRQTAWYVAFYILMALAVLTKGPVGIVIPGLIIGAFLLYCGNLWTVLREMRLLLGGLIFLGMTLPWYVLIIREHGQTYINNFFGYHNLERFTHVVNNHSAPWYFYGLVVLIGFIPWSSFLPVAIARLRFWRRQHWQHQARSAQLGIFAFIWFAVIFLFFSISVTKLPSYTIPLLPAAGILVALLWSEQMTRPVPSRGLQISGVVTVGLWLAVAGATAYGANWMEGDPATPNLAAAVRQSSVLPIGAAIWGATALTAAVWSWRRRSQWLWLINLVGFTTFFVLTLMPLLKMTDSQRQEPLYQLSQTIVQAQAPDEEILMVGFKKPSVVFYTEQPVTFIYSPNEAIAHLRDTLENTPELTSALMLGTTDILEESRLKPRQYEVVDEAGVYRLIRINLQRIRRKQRNSAVLNLDSIYSLVPASGRLP
ncbi:MAG: glycosyltransferase family 39 protein [Elainellaceae cyanobacterium]